MTEQINKNPINRMALMSQYAGIFSVVSLILFFIFQTPTGLLLAVFLSCMGILFAHLSKGPRYQIPRQAMSGLGSSIFSLSLSLILILFSLMGLYMMIRMFGLETILDPEALEKALTDFYSNYTNLLQTGGYTF